MAGIVVDSRRAIWLVETRTVAVADTHFGHGWVERQRGLLLPVPPTEEGGLGRIAQLIWDYEPARLVVVGDVVHASRNLPALEAECRKLVSLCEVAQTELVLVLGNHDRGLPRQLESWGMTARCEPEFRDGRFHFLHGDEPPRTVDGGPGGSGGFRIVGHEHPSITLRGNANRCARCPSFLLGESVLVLPAFTERAAGCDVGRGRFLGPVASEARFRFAVACVGDRLLRLPWPLPE